MADPVDDARVAALTDEAWSQDDQEATGHGSEPHVFPRSWLRAGVAWWVLSTVGAVVVVGGVRTSIPFMVRLVLVAGLSTIPGLGLSRLLVRRSFPSMRTLWWRWLYALRCFFVYGYLAALVLLYHWLERYPTGSRPWASVTWLADAFGLAGAVVWGLVVRDTLRHGLGGRDRSEVAIDLFMAAVVVSGPVALAVNRLHKLPAHDVIAVMAVLRPVDAAFGIAAGVFWCGCLTQMLRQTAGLRAVSVDTIDLVAAVVALGAPPLLAVVPVLARHGDVLWLTVPLLFLGTVLPGLVCAGGVLLARVPERVRRSIGVWIVVLLVVSTVDAWCQLAMALSGYRLSAGLLIVPAAVNFGIFLWIPLSERRRPVLGLGRLSPEAQLRRWDLVPAVVGLGAMALVAELLVGSRTGSPEGVAAAVLLGALVVLAAVRHYATIGEARRLHGRIRSMTDELYQQSRVDPLTGLFNRRMLAERFPQLAASCARAGRPLSVAMVDLDHFKRFNDEHGHVAGDQLLRELAGRLQGALCHEDLAARFGGEEFCLVFPGAEPHQIVPRLQRVRLGAASSPGGRAGSTPDLLPGRTPDPLAGPAPIDRHPPVAPDPVRPRVTFSAGVAGWQPGEGFEDVVRRADAACYAAKAAGRDRVVVDVTAVCGRPADDPVGVPGRGPASAPVGASPGGGGLSVERAMALADALLTEALAAPPARAGDAVPPAPSV